MIDNGISLNSSFIFLLLHCFLVAYHLSWIILNYIILCLTYIKLINKTYHILLMITSTSKLVYKFVYSSSCSSFFVLIFILFALYGFIQGAGMADCLDHLTQVRNHLKTCQIQFEERISQLSVIPGKKARYWVGPLCLAHKPISCKDSKRMCLSTIILQKYHKLKRNFIAVTDSYSLCPHGNNSFWANSNRNVIKHRLK